MKFTALTFLLLAATSFNAQAQDTLLPYTGGLPMVDTTAQPESPEWAKRDENANPTDAAAFQVTGSAGLFSDYRFRGISQTGNEPAVQANAEIAHESGLKFGIWAGNVDFGNPDAGSMESDFTLVYQKSFDALTLSGGATYYAYPGSEDDLDYDYTEIFGTAAYNFDPVTVSASLYHSWDFFGGSGDSLYPILGLTAPLPIEGLSLESSIGYQWIDDEAAYGVPDYADWMLGLRYSFLETNTVYLRYQDTDLSDTECTSGCGSTVVAGITHSF